MASPFHSNTGEGMSSLQCDRCEGVASLIDCDTGEGMACTSYTKKVWICIHFISRVETNITVDLYC